MTLAEPPAHRRLRVALVSPYDFAYPGGVTEHVAHLAEHLRRRGQDVHIIAPSSDDETEPPVADDSSVHRIGRVVSMPANGSVARITLSVRAYLQVKRLLREQAFDVIHLHEPMMPALPLTVLRHSQTTNVGTFHAYRRSPLAYFYAKPFLQGFFKKLHGHIAVSASARDFVGEYFREAQYRIIPNGIDFARFSTPRPPLARFQDGRPMVLFVGRLEKRKGLRFLLRAWPLVREQFEGARLVVVGEGRPLEGYRRVARRQGWTEDDVYFAGHVAGEDLPRYYQAASVFCAPSTGQESFGIVLLEAMAAGVPIVASDIPGYRDVVTHGEQGLLATPEDPRALGSAIALLLLNPDLRERMCESGQALARAHDWQHVAGKVLDYYAEVMERRVLADPSTRQRFGRVRRMAKLLG